MRSETKICTNKFLYHTKSCTNRFIITQGNNKMIFMHKKAIALLIAIIVIASGTWAYFYLTEQKGITITPPGGGWSTPSSANASSFSFEFVDPSYTTAVPQYPLPLDLAEIDSFNSIDSFFGLNSAQKNLLKNNGFVGIREDEHNFNDFSIAYNALKTNRMPIFVTTDSILHTHHVFFDDTLRFIEEEYLINYSENMTIGMLERAEQQYLNTNGEIKELARKNVAYFSIALKLIKPNASIPSYVSDIVNEELSLIEAHKAFIWSPLFVEYMEDYSQYKPRGHYTRSEALKRYFKEMMWYGRMMFRIKSDNETKQAIMIADGMRTACYDGYASDFWEKIYQVTTFFVGYSDDLTYKEYLNVTNQVYENLSEDYHELTNTSKLEGFKEKIKEMRIPKICSSFVLDIQNVINETQGLRFMGQRFIPDSYMFQELVYDKVGTRDKPRLFPKGLDVMAVLGNEEARRLEEPEKQYLHYEEQLTNLTFEFSQYNQTAWTQNLYWGWLYSLKSLNENFSKGDYPTFMRNQAWQDEKLNTNLASWTELRHDTILYAKQSYTIFVTSVPPKYTEKGYVEPVPTFYSRLKDLTNATVKGLTNLSVLSENRKNELVLFANLLKDLENISIKELQNEELSDDDYELIRSVGDIFEDLTGSANSEGKETTLIADVHSDPNSGRCLEEAVGYIDFIVVVIKKPNGDLTSMAGPIFSYYEFKQPMSNRLTDEEWRDLLQSGNAPKQPDWIELFAP